MHGIILLFVLICAKETRGNHDAKRLYDDLLRKRAYSKLIRPVSNSTEKLVIKMGLRLTQIIDVDERNEIIAMNMWVLHEWEDQSLRWNPVEYGGVKMLYVPAESIWRPDIVLYNNADGHYVITLKTKATISWFGRVQWVPPAVYKSHCNIDVRYFPFDQQVCFLKFGSWSYDGDQVDLKHIWHERFGLAGETDVVNPGWDLRSFYRSVEWDIMQTSAQKNIRYYPCCQEPYPDVTFNITLKRKTLFYSINLIMPCLSITLLTILDFYLPSDAGEKISLSISLLLSLSLFQLLLLELVPPTSLTMPLIGEYILFTTIVVTLSVLSSVVTLNVNFRSPNTCELPVCVKHVFLVVIPKLLFMQRPDYLDRKNRSICDEEDDDVGGGPRTGGLLYDRQTQTESLMTSSDIRFSSTFVGFSHSNHVPWCKACHQTHRVDHQLPLTARKAIEGIRFVANHAKEQDSVDEVKQDWKFMALVIDRLLLWVYIAVCIVGSVGVLVNAPSLYDMREPLYTYEQ